MDFFSQNDVVLIIVPDPILFSKELRDNCSDVCNNNQNITVNNNNILLILILISY